MVFSRNFPFYSSILLKSFKTEDEAVLPCPPDVIKKTESKLNIPEVAPDSEQIASHYYSIRSYRRQIQVREINQQLFLTAAVAIIFIRHF